MIERLINKYDSKIEGSFKKRSGLNGDVDAEYWLLLGKEDTLSEVIVDLIEEYSKENKLNEYLKKQLSIHKLKQ